MTNQLFVAALLLPHLLGDEFKRIMLTPYRTDVDESIQREEREAELGAVLFKVVPVTLRTAAALCQGAGVGPGHPPQFEPVQEDDGENRILMPGAS